MTRAIVRGDTLTTKMAFARSAFVVVSSVLVACQGAPPPATPTSVAHTSVSTADPASVVRSYLDAVARGQGRDCNMMIIAPPLFQQLVTSDPSLKTFGNGMLMMDSPPPPANELPKGPEGRIYMNADCPKFAKAAGSVRFAATFSGAPVRPATKEERELILDFSPQEIAAVHPEPWVVGAGDHELAAIVMDDEITYLDDLTFLKKNSTTEQVTAEPQGARKTNRAFAVGSVEFEESNGTLERELGKVDPFADWFTAFLDALDDDLVAKPPATRGPGQVSFEVSPKGPAVTKKAPLGALPADAVARALARVASLGPKTRSEAVHFTITFDVGGGTARAK